ncbi:hypothetical protein ABK040_016400 [Willaertia magna]
MIKTTTKTILPKTFHKKLFSQPQPQLQLYKNFSQHLVVLFTENVDNNKYLKTYSVKGFSKSGSTVETTAITTCPNVKVILDEPKPIGANLGPTPLEHALMSLLGCEIITARRVAQVNKLNIKEVNCTKMEGTLDVRGMRAVEGIQVHFQKVEMAFEVETNETDEKVQELKEKVESTCPVYQLFKAAGCKLNAEWKRK